MGLDQYAYRRKKGQNKKDMEQIAYWRKHNRLHGWMENRWRERKGEEVEGKEFNCVRFRLKENDILQFMKDKVSDNFPETKGFFFGSDSKGLYETEDLEFCLNALEAIASGDKIYYDSWW